MPPEIELQLIEVCLYHIIFDQKIFLIKSVCQKIQPRSTWTYDFRQASCIHLNVWHVSQCLEGLFTSPEDSHAVVHLSLICILVCYMNFLITCLPHYLSLSPFVSRLRPITCGNAVYKNGPSMNVMSHQNGSHVCLQKPNLYCNQWGSTFRIFHCFFPCACLWQSCGSNAFLNFPPPHGQAIGLFWPFLEIL